MGIVTDTDRTIAGSWRTLRGSQKSSKGAPLYSLFVNRPLGRVLAAVAYRLDLRPNQVTGVSAVMTFAAVALIALARPSVLVGVAAMVLLCLGYALDSADGQLARLRGGGSLTGEWLDHVIDCAKTSAIHLAVLVSFYRYFALPRWLLVVPMVFAVSAAVQFFGMVLNEQLARNRRLQLGLGGVLPASTSPFWVTVVRAPVDYGVLCVVFGTFGLHPVFVALYALMTLAGVLHLGVLLPKWFRDMGRLDRLTAEEVRHG